MAIRTTLTIEDDIAIKLKEYSRTHGLSFKDAVNEVFRSGLMHQHNAPQRNFHVQPKAMGAVAGLNYDRISTLLETLEGQDKR